ncbi:MAG: hypothetical protein ABIB04_04030 [Patescibacteria group bacterium]
MAKRNVSEIETGAGFFMGFVSATMDVVREKAYPFAAIYRLATAGGRTTLVKIVDLAYTDWQAEQPKPIEQPEGGHPYRGGPQNGNAPFSAPIVYVQPEFEELKRRFPAYVNPDYKGKRFDPIERCKAVSKENREVAFEYVHLDRDASTDEVLAEMDRKGLRPALYEELLGFAEKYPDEQRKYPIVALGSEAYVDGDRYVACLWDDYDGRNLYLHWLDDGWDGIVRFLAVRK